MKKLFSLSLLPTDEIKDKQEDSLIAWIETQAKAWQVDYLLAHGEDGVIWGRFDDSKLTTADQVFEKNVFGVDLPRLRLSTLQQCRLFGKNGEILLWSTDRGWQSRIIQDHPDIDPDVDCISEWQILWGTQAEKGKNEENGEKDGFTLLSDGSQGLKQAIPLTGIQFKSDKKRLHRPVRLGVHHYIDYDDSGIARIFLSRLVSLKSVCG